jgi:hypothetical protein
MESSLTLEQRDFHLEALGQRVCQNAGCRNTRESNPHHVVYQQWLKRHRPDLLWDPRNCLRLCNSCHANHHGLHQIPLTCLKDANYEFAFEVMGEAAYDYLRQKYDGEDPRLEEWLARTTAV